MTALVSLRNTFSGKSQEYTKEEADRILAHPVFGKVNKVVRTAKPEILAPKDAAATDVSAPEPEAEEAPASRGKILAAPSRNQKEG